MSGADAREIMSAGGARARLRTPPARLPRTRVTTPGGRGAGVPAPACGHPGTSLGQLDGAAEPTARPGAAGGSQATSGAVNIIACVTTHTLCATPNSPTRGETGLILELCSAQRATRAEVTPDGRGLKPDLKNCMEKGRRRRRPFSETGSATHQDRFRSARAPAGGRPP